MTAYLVCDKCGFKMMSMSEANDNGMVITCRHCGFVKKLNREDAQDTIKAKCCTSESIYNGRGRCQNWF